MTVLEEHSRCKKYKYLGVPQKGSLKKKTEGMIMAAQDQALRTNSIKRIIDKQNVSAKCRMCGESDETVSHIVSECKKLDQKQYRGWRQEKVAQVIHWELCGKLGYDRDVKCYNHEPLSVYESTNNKLLCGTSKYRLTTRLNTTSPTLWYWIR